MEITPTDNRVLVKVAKREEYTPGGLVIPKTVEDQNSLQEGLVVATGPGELVPTGAGMATRAAPCDVGQTVLFGRFSGAKMEVDGEEHILLHGSEVMAIVNKG